MNNSFGSDIPAATASHENKYPAPNKFAGLWRFSTVPVYFTGLLLLIALFCVPCAIAAGRTECRPLPARFWASRLLLRLSASQLRRGQGAQFPVLYFLHGLGENAQTLLNSGGWNLIENLWEQKQIGEFLIVTPSADRSFYINSRDGKVRYEDFFIREFLPFIESHYRIQAERRTAASPGFPWAAMARCAWPSVIPQLFGSVSAHSAALVAKLPEVQASEVRRQRRWRRAMGTAFGTPFDRAYWDKKIRSRSSKTARAPMGMKIYFDCGTEDEFGFDAGAQAFHESPARQENSARISSLSRRA